jgi:hypothetical protein
MTVNMTMTMNEKAVAANDFHDPLLGSNFKGYPRTQAPRRRSEIGAAGWNVLAGDLPLPLAILKREALEHNLAWMQARVREWGIDLAPHGKTTMSPQLFKRQLDAGAWGLTFATVTQLAVGVAAGARRALIANQVVSDEDLAGIQMLLRAHADLRIVFLVDSLAQLALIEDWSKRHPASVPFEVMLEIGIDAGRTGCRTHDGSGRRCQRTARQRRRRSWWASRATKGQNATGSTEVDAAFAKALMDRDRSGGPPLRHAAAVRDRRGAGLGRRLGHFRPRGRQPQARTGLAGSRPAALGLLRHARPRLLQAHGERGRRAHGLRVRRRPDTGDGSLGQRAVAARAGPGDSCRSASATSLSTCPCPSPSRARHAACCGRMRCPPAGK